MKQTFHQKAFIQLCLKSGLPAPIPEFVFAPPRKWRIDFYLELEGKKVALEVEGGVWKIGRHNRPQGFLKDVEKYNNLSMNGIYLLRVEPKNLLKNTTISMLKKVLGLLEVS